MARRQVRVATPIKALQIFDTYSRSRRSHSDFQEIQSDILTRTPLLSDLHCVQTLTSPPWTQHYQLPALRQCTLQSVSQFSPPSCLAAAFIYSSPLPPVVSVYAADSLFSHSPRSHFPAVFVSIQSLFSYL